MTAAELNLMIEAKDKSGKVFTTVGRRFGNLRAKAARAAQQMRAGFTKFASVFKKSMLAAVATIGLVIAGITKLTKATIRENVALDKTAKTLGMTAAEVEKLNYVMVQEHGDMQRLTKALINLNKFIGDAGEGIKTYADAFHALDIDVRKTNGALRSSYDVFMDMVSAVHKGNIQTEEMDALATLLGSRIVGDLIPAMKKGTKWWELMGDEAFKLMGVSEETFNSMVTDSKKFDDKIAELKQAWKGWRLQLTAKIEPYLSKVVDWLTKEGLPGLRKGFVENQKAIREWAAMGLGHVLLFAKAMMELAKIPFQMAKGLNRLKGTLLALEMIRSTKQLDNYRAGLVRLDARYEKSNQKRKATIARLKEQAEAGRNVSARLAQEEQKLVDGTKRYEERRKEQEKLIIAQDAYTKALDSEIPVEFDEEMNKIIRSFEAIVEKVGDAKKGVDDYKEALGKETPEIEAPEAKAPEVAEKVRELPVRMEAVIKGLKTTYDEKTGQVMRIGEAVISETEKAKEGTVVIVDTVSEMWGKIKIILHNQNEQTAEIEKLRLQISES